MIFRMIFRDLQPRVALAWATLLVAACGGGASQPDVLSLLYVRPALVFIAVLTLMLYRQDMRHMRVPVVLMAALATWIALQLIPLPPTLWHNLPGHGLIKTISAAAGLQGVWRPISISPDATINSLLACIPAFTALAVVAPLNTRTRKSLVDLLLILIVGSMFLGVLQIVSRDSSFMLFRRSNEDTAVGLFANRNHFALLLASGLPLLGAWSLGDSEGRQISAVRSFLAGIGAVFILVMIIATGSRAGLGLSVVAALAAMAIRWRNTVRTPATSHHAKWRPALIAFACIVIVAIILSATIAFKGVAFERLFRTTGELGSERRLTLAPVVMSAIWPYFPFGSGFGTFDHVFRQIEPDWALAPTYFNHAHNELFELLLTGGLPAAILLFAFVVFIFRLCRNALRSEPGGGTAHAQAGAMILVLAILASIVDYPLRTPLMDVVAVFAIALATTGKRKRARSAAHGSAVALAGAGA